MNKTLILSLALFTTQCSAIVPTGISPTDQAEKTIKLVLNNLSVEKEDAWIRLFTKIAEKNTQSLQECSAFILDEISRAKTKNQEILLRRLSAITQALLSKMEPRLILDVMPVPTQSIGKYLVGIAAACGLAYYLLSPAIHETTQETLKETGEVV